MSKKIFFLTLYFLLFVAIKEACANPVGFAIAFVVSFIATTIVLHPIIAAMIAYSIYSSSKNKPNSSKYVSSVIENAISNEGIVPIIYGGPILVGGTILWQSSPGTTVQRFLGLCIGEVSAITDVLIDDQAIAGLSGCSYTAYYGTSTQTVDSRGVATVKGLRNIAYLALTITSGDKVSSNPVVACRVTGRKIQTWNTGAQDWTTNAVSASKNPAAIIRDYLLLSSVLGGCGVPAAYVDDTSFGDFSETCDEDINNGAGGTENRYELDIIIDTQRSALDNLALFLVTCNAALIRSGATYKIAVEKSGETAVMAFTEDNIIKGTFSYGYGKAEETPNKVGVEWISALEAKNPKRLAWAEDELDQEIRGIHEEKTEAYGIIRQSQASRLAKKRLYEKKLNDIWCELESNMEAMHCEPIDVVSVTHSRPNWTTAAFRVMEINETDFGRAKYLLKAYNSSVLDDKHGSTFDDWDYGSPPNPYTPVTDVTGIVLTEVGWRNADGIHIAHIDVAWVAPATKKEFLDGYIIELKKGSDDYIVVGSAPLSALEYRINLNLEIDVTYYVRIKTRNTEGIISDGTVSTAIALVGKDTAPSNVSAFIVKKFRDFIVCKWTKVTDVDVQKYEIRKGTSWGSAGIVATPVYGDELSIRDIRIGTSQSYWIKAIDNSGNYSNTAKEAIVTVGNIPFQNIIDTFTEHPAWGGTKDDTETSGNNLIISATFLTGTYITAVKDLGYICEVRIMIAYIDSIAESLAWDSDPTAAFDDSTTLRFTGEEAPGVASFRIRTSIVGNDPTNGAHAWTAWETWITADFNCRWFQIEMTITRESLTTTLLISNLTITADLPDVDSVQDGEVTVAASGYDITFVKTYHEDPAINVTILTGDGYVWKATGLTITGVNIKLYKLDGNTTTGQFKIGIHGV